MAFGVVGEVVRLSETEVWVEADVCLCAQCVADPPDTQLVDLLHAWRVRNNGFGLFNQCRVNGVHESREDLPGGRAQDPEDGKRYDQPDDRIGQPDAHGDPARAHEHSEAGKAVSACVQSVRDERGRSDPAPDTDAVPGDDLIADKTDQPGDGHSRQVADRPWMQQAVNGDIGGDPARRRNEQQHDQTGQVLSAAVAVREAAGSGPRAPPEGDQQRTCSKRVSKVVKRVTEQGNRMRQHDDDRLEPGRQEESTQADKQGPPTLSICFKSVVDLIRSVVAVAEQGSGEPCDPTVVMVSGVVIPVFVMVRVVVRVHRHSGDAAKSRGAAPQPLRQCVGLAIGPGSEQRAKRQ
jgi:hypothetical protein